MGKPVIGVSINYRLGLLGFLGSTELEDEERAGNYGLMDQVTAFKWIQRNIAGFGGDSGNVTVFGESAGSISINLHLLRDEPLFQRAICMSGDPRLRQPQPIEVNERTTFQPLVSSLGLADLPASEKLESLHRTPWETLVKSNLNVRVFPSVSSGFVPLEAEFEPLRDQVARHFSWCKSLMVGDCAQDASAFRRGALKPNWVDDFNVAAEQYLERQEVEAIHELYKLGHSGLPNTEPGLTQFISDVRFYLPVVLMRMAAPKSADLRIYHLLEGNSFEGPFKGAASHVLDIALILQNYDEHLPMETSALGKRMAENFIDFANGIPETTAKTDGGPGRQTTVWGPDGRHRQMSEHEYDSSERGSSAELLKKIGLDKCIATLELFQFGRRL
ncbi:Carboxylesterase [Ilyonectria destructans]|nr:Carboxylesterase [Ilyonectria destructans]